MSLSLVKYGAFFECERCHKQKFVERGSDIYTIEFEEYGYGVRSGKLFCAACAEQYDEMLRRFCTCGSVSPEKDIHGTESDRTQNQIAEGGGDAT